VVDLDIEKFFDRVNHDLLMPRVRAVVHDVRVRTLIGRYLKAGVMINGVVRESGEGTPQGGPLSPLLANIYLDPLDRELESRGLSHVRYADDCNIYVSSATAAARVLASVIRWIERHLRLRVNHTKSGSGPCQGGKFDSACRALPCGRRYRAVCLAPLGSRLQPERRGGGGSGGQKRGTLQGESA
jgi:hypothetical protein